MTYFQNNIIKKLSYFKCVPASWGCQRELYEGNSRTKSLRTRLQFPKSFDVHRALNLENDPIANRLRRRRTKLWFYKRNWLRNGHLYIRNEEPTTILLTITILHTGRVNNGGPCTLARPQIWWHRASAILQKTGARPDPIQDHKSAYESVVFQTCAEHDISSYNFENVFLPLWIIMPIFLLYR